MKLRVPAGCDAVSHRGRLLRIGADRSIEVDDADWVDLLTHGFSPWSALPTAADLSPQSPEDSVDQVMNATLKKLQRNCAEPVCAKPLSPDEPLLDSEAKIAARSMASSNPEIGTVSKLKRCELFALLRSKGVSVSLPVTNNTLRALARHALG